MKLARETRRSDHLGRYYTDFLIGSYLINAMATLEPSSVIDLGAGSGALTQAGSKVWTNSSFFTVDIDATATSASFATTLGSSFRHFKVDALDDSLPYKLGLNWAEVDAAICNPPYLMPKWKKHFNNILEDAGLRQFVAKTGDISADILFIAQNLRMLKAGGKLGLIIPDSIITGEKYSSFRKALINFHCVEKVIELPRRAFKNTDAKAYILVLSKNADANAHIAVSALRSNGILTEKILVPTERFSDRLDYSYISSLKKSVGKRTIGGVTETIFRGTISSIETKSSTLPVFHTTDFKDSYLHVPRRFHISSKKKQSIESRFATTGDILIARVGRNLSSKVCIVKHKGYVAISDCILVLRVKEFAREPLLSFLRSDRGRERIKACTKGVSAQFITPNSLSEIKF